MQLENTEK